MWREALADVGGAVFALAFSLFAVFLLVLVVASCSPAPFLVSQTSPSWVVLPSGIHKIEVDEHVDCYQPFRSDGSPFSCVWHP